MRVTATGPRSSRSSPSNSLNSSASRFPPFQDEGRRERLWFQWFADAAAYCEARGQRLVLVVDGLDEDRGVTGPGARSIAGLLPANPPHRAR
ncbi:hypothetical protein, partial [Frankia tisae]|uniref:hypothetical protein n=1 Tax=Frankia tisae TaxID=2950104 RepID=UPI0021C139CB